ncbi:hypothetical protein Pint_10752 [Pistacia integerrima]|uniref:Uncharacterized protein n=1 Tax=Pistacia integerrima TaxID=434235 RepID=A0ACC0XH65_9ROSI|nr:hypothetical protein Pint_10752 [Pistacia integerrima]
MATKTSVFVNLALVLALLLAISMAEGHRTFGAGFLKAKSAPQCESVTGVNSGDTCSAIAEAFGLTADLFGAINPNLNCDELFVGQWLCVAGSA